MNEVFVTNDQSEDIPRDKANFGKIPSSDIAIERDGANPEFVTPGYDENKLEPDNVGVDVDNIQKSYDLMVNHVASENKPPLKRTTNPNIPEADVQATGGFNLSEIVGWYQVLAEQTRSNKNAFSPKTGGRHSRNIEQLKKTANFKPKSAPPLKSDLDWKAGIEKLDSFSPSVKGLMLLAQTNMEALAAAVTDEGALGVKAVTAILPKSNLSSLYKGLDNGDKLAIQAISQAIKENNSHGWCKPIEFKEKLKPNQLRWEYAKYWSFYPHLYLDDVVSGLEPMWIFEGFAEVDDGTDDRKDIFEDYEKIYGESSEEFEAERAGPREKWEKRGVDPLKEAIIEMREFGSDKMPLNQIAQWAASAFLIYQKFKLKK